MIIVPPLHVGYQEVPKVASTTLTAWLWAHLKVADPAAAARTTHSWARQRLRDPATGNAVVRNTAEALQPHAPLFTFALTRDPIKRFVSMYRNRVVHFRELSAASHAATALTQRGLAFDPQINDLVDHWEAYAACGKSVAHHALGQMHFLGPDLGVFRSLTDVSALPSVLAAIKAEWAARGLTALADVTVPVRKSQTGGPPLGLEALSEASFDKLMALYDDDYRHLPTLNRDAIVAEYRKARATHAPDGGVPYVTFDAQPSAPAPAPAPQPQPRPASDTAATPVAALRLKSSAAPSRPGAVVLRGVLVLKPGTDAETLTLLVKTGDAEHACQWPLSSPLAAKEWPQNPLAAKARFTSAPIPLAAGDIARLCLRGAEGDDLVVAEYRPAPTGG